MSALAVGDTGVGDDPYGELTARLVDAQLLYPLGVTGLYGRSATYQSIADAIDAMVGRWAATLGAEMIHFPPIIARGTFDHTNYLQSFPDLMGSVHVFTGDDRAHRELLRRVESDGDWPALLEPAEVVLSSAACHSALPPVHGRAPGGRPLLRGRRHLLPPRAQPRPGPHAVLLHARGRLRRRTRRTRSATATRGWPTASASSPTSGWPWRPSRPTTRSSVAWAPCWPPASWTSS